MGPFTNNPPLVVIAGPTASGKSALALKLAERFGGEIVAADSRTIYRGMDIGTAKPTPEDQRAIPHHLLDMAAPDELITVADFQKMALSAINQIGRGRRLAIMVGGNGLYVDAVIYGFQFRKRQSIYEREWLEEAPIEELQQELAERGIDLPANVKNRRHLIGALEIGGVVKDERRLRPNTLVLGIDISKDELDARITSRVAGMFAQGLEVEVRGLVSRYGWTGQLPETIGYAEFRHYLSGELSHEQLIQDIALHTRQYAKRQKTWFKRNSDIHWISNPEEAVDLVTTFLNN